MQQQECTMKTLYDFAVVYQDEVQYDEVQYSNIKQLQETLEDFVTVVCDEDSVHTIYGSEVTGQVEFEQSINELDVDAKVNELQDYFGRDADAADLNKIDEKFRQLVEKVKSNSALVMVEYSLEADISFLVIERCDLNEIVM
jgi:hypothetical protein